jgi:serine/threonine protein kinase
MSVHDAVARGMAYLHSRRPPILHLDLKSPNILVDAGWRAKIADFGLSLAKNRTYASTTAAMGTPEWMAPEVLRCERYDERADVFSFGVVLWELLTAQQPWADHNPMQASASALGMPHPACCSHASHASSVEMFAEYFCTLTSHACMLASRCLASLQVVGCVGYNSQLLPVPDEGEPLLRSLCARCMTQDPAVRPLFPEASPGMDALKHSLAGKSGHSRIATWLSSSPNEWRAAELAGQGC